MVFIPDLDTAIVDPFCEIPTLSVTGNAMVIDYPETVLSTNIPETSYKPLSAI